MTGQHENVKLRQVQDEIAFMRSPEGWNIDLAKLYDDKKKSKPIVIIEFIFK